MDSPSENRRESALTVRKEARPFYAALFVLQTFGLVARRFYIALTDRYQDESLSFWQALSAAIDEGKLLDVVAVSLSELERDGAKAVISTIVLMEAWDIMMATRDTVNEWLGKRREKARAEGRVEGIAEERAAMIQALRDAGIPERDIQRVEIQRDANGNDPRAGMIPPSTTSVARTKALALWEWRLVCDIIP